MTFILQDLYIQIPFLVASLCIIRKFQGLQNDMKKIFYFAVIYVIVLYQPGITTVLALFTSCDTQKNLGYNYITVHPHWTCDSSRYIFVSKYIVIPNLIFWIIIVSFSFTVTEKVKIIG